MTRSQIRVTQIEELEECDNSERNTQTWTGYYDDENRLVECQMEQSVSENLFFLNILWFRIYKYFFEIRNFQHLLTKKPS